MNRRSFLKYTAPVGTGALLLKGMPVSAFASPAMLAMNCNAVYDRTLVIVNLKGGNDGLNMIVPQNQLSEYHNLRPTIGLPDSSTTLLDSTLASNQQVRLHPSAVAGLKTMYDAGEAAIVNGVSYPSYNRSHFKSSDLMLTGTDGSGGSNLDTGWMGRFLQSYAPGAAGSSTTQFPDPLGVQLGDKKTSLGFYTYHTNQAAINLTGQNASNFGTFINEIGGAAPSVMPTGEFGAEVQHIVNIENSTAVYANRISTTYAAGTNLGAYPSGNLPNQLKIVARLLNGGSKTKIFMVNVGGYDTHSNQVNTGDSTTGKHADLTGQLFDAIRAFHDDLKLMGISGRVLTTTFTEFGRKATENGSRGTDHGTLAPVFLFGEAVQAGVYGTNPDLTSLGGNDGSLPLNMQHDYRSVYKTLLQNWLAGGDPVMNATFPTGTFPTIPLIRPASVPDPSCMIGGILPVELQRFDARLVDGEVVELDWMSDLELNFSHYQIERSPDGRSWEALDRVPGRGSVEGELVEYAYEDAAPLAGESYYRLRMVDLDNSVKFSEVRAVFLPRETVKTVKMYPNPAVHQVTVTATLTQAAGDATIRFVSAAGMVHRVQTADLRQGFNKITLPVNDLSAGQYFVRVEAGGRLLAPVMMLVVTR